MFEKMSKTAGNSSASKQHIKNKIKNKLWGETDFWHKGTVKWKEDSLVDFIGYWNGTQFGMTIRSLSANYCSWLQDFTDNQPYGCRHR